jgi:hypothetical protein
MKELAATTKNISSKQENWQKQHPATHHQTQQKHPKQKIKPTQGEIQHSYPKGNTTTYMKTQILKRGADKMYQKSY